MKISKELIERYHRDECSLEEKEWVAAWLFADDGEGPLELDEPTKALFKAEIWDEVKTVLPQEQTVIPIISSKFQFWKGAIAASIVFVLLFIGLVSYQLLVQKEILGVDIENTSAQQIQYVNAKDFKLSVGTNTSAKIDHKTGIVDLTGSILIQPKEDIELEFSGSTKKVSLKKGQTYIILKGKDGADKAIIVNEKNLIDLPPVLQKQIINEFKI